MKRLTTATILSVLAALALGCKGSSPAKSTPAAGEATANEGPLLPPGHGAFGGGGAAQAGAGPADATAAGGRRDGTPRGPLAGGPRRWGEDLTPEEREARKAEMRERRAEERQMVIDTFDADQDGRLSEAERGAMHQARVAQMVDRLDTDRDGKLSKAELEGMPSRGRRPAPDFAAIDADKDGFVSVEEMTKSRPPGGPRGPGLRAGWGGAGRPDGATVRTVPAQPPEAPTN